MKKLKHNNCIIDNVAILTHFSEHIFIGEWQ